jgi:hypothetical protein
MMHSELFLEHFILENKHRKVFETSVNNQTTRRHMSEDVNPRSNRCDNRNTLVYFSLPEFNHLNAAL